MKMRFHPVMGVLGLMLLSGSANAQSADRVEGAIPEEVQAFKESAERFQKRSDEMRTDTREFIAFREAEERAKISAGYDPVLESLAELERNQRDLAVRRFEEFLAKYPDTPYSSHVRFRLADLYFEVENERWLEQSETYFARLNDENLSLEDAERLEAEGEPRLDLSRSVALYKRIVADNVGLPPEDRYERLDGAYLMLGFVYAEENASLPTADYPATNDQGDPFDPESYEDVDRRKSALAKATFRELIRENPDSALADRAHLFLGNFLFDEGAFDEAKNEYRLVYARGEDSPYFDESIYQLAWSHYKTDVYDEAIPLFTEVLDRSEQQKTDTGRESSFRTDAVRYMAFSFGDQGLLLPQGALGVAQTYFSTTGAKEYEWDVYRELSTNLVRYGRWDEAIEVLSYLQEDPRWVNRPENPELQMQIVQLYGNETQLADFEKSGAARLQLTSQYNEGSEWWEANRNNPDALAVARGYIESSLGQVAEELRVRAQESEDPADYLVAAEKYQEYLDKFPISDDYYTVQWLLADSLRNGGDTEGALREYESLIKSAAYHPFLDGTLVFRLQIYFQDILQNAPPEVVPEGADVLRTYTSADDKEIQVYALGELQKKFIESADAVLEHDFAEPVDGAQDFRPFIENNEAGLRYLPGQILHAHQQFDESRPRLEDVIDRMPRTNEASYSARLLVDSYILEGNLAEVRKATNRFSTMVLGPTEIADPEGYFRSTLELAAFDQAKLLAESEDEVAAAEAFLKFNEDFPDSENKEFSLFNAASLYQRAGQAEKANGLYERFLTEYPDSERSEQLYQRVAALYESTLELNKAVDYYDQLNRRFPDGENAADALYNASYLRTGLGRSREAAQGFERYGTAYSDKPDAEKVFFLAGEQWEAVSNRDALRFYDRYLSTFDFENPDNALTAMGRKAAIYDGDGDKRSYNRELDKIQDAFDRITGQGVTLGPSAHRWAATAAFRDLEAQYDAFMSGELTRNETKDKKLIEDREAEAPGLANAAKAFSERYDDFDYATRALFIHAMAPLRFADIGLGVEPPTGLTEDQEFAYWDILEERVFPRFRAFEEEGIKRLVDLTQAAKNSKRHSQAIEDAYRELNDRNPTDYPDLKAEIEGATRSTNQPPIDPVRMRTQEAE